MARMLTRPRRQIAATFALALFTIAPTVTIAWTVRGLGQPAHLREVEAEIGRRLGVLVKVESATHPRPDVDVLRNVSLRLHDSADSEIARADCLRISRSSGEMNMKVDSLQVRGDGASDALNQTLSFLRRMASSAESRISLVADRCEVRLGKRVETLREMAAIVDVDRSTPSMSASYLLDDDQGHLSRCELAISCQAGGITRVTLRTMDGPVLARVLSPFFDVESWLGASARLDGTLTLTRKMAGSWDSEFRGELFAIDLSSVVGRRFAGHRLTGLGRLKIETAKWAERPGGQGPGWVEARGTLSAGPGSISTGLLEALKSRMQFRLDSNIEPGRTDIDYQGLGLLFAMNSDGELALRGGLGAEYAPDAVLVHGHHGLPLARSPAGAANVRGLWNTLIPTSPGTLAPVVPEMHSLGALPLPRGGRGRMSAN
jgi:hypothetical protein